MHAFKTPTLRNVALTPPYMHDGVLGTLEEKVILFSLVPSYVIAGVLVYLYDRDLRETITQKYIEEALTAATAIERMRLFEEAEQLAITDGLTGLLNHREFQKRLAVELERSKRYNREFSLLADQALYFAKEAGRNSVYQYSESLKSAIERNHGKLTELLLDPSLSAVKDLARVLSVVESYHAMISIRPYRRRLTLNEAMEELRQNAGTQFDPAMVETFLRMIENNSR